MFLTQKQRDGDVMDRHLNGQNVIFCVTQPQVVPEVKLDADVAKHIGVAFRDLYLLCDDERESVLLNLIILCEKEFDVSTWFCEEWVNPSTEVFAISEIFTSGACAVNDDHGGNSASRGKKKRHLDPSPAQSVAKKRRVADSDENEEQKKKTRKPRKKAPKVFRIAKGSKKKTKTKQKTKTKTKPNQRRGSGKVSPKVGMNQNEQVRVNRNVIDTVKDSRDVFG